MRATQIGTCKTASRFSAAFAKPAWILASGLLAAAPDAVGFDSGSTGVDGAFAPSVDTELQLPEDGIFNFTTIDIPKGVTITFAKNTRNTPVILLASGDVNIAGTIDVSGTASPAAGTADDGVVGDDGLPGAGGPGGYGGGVGGLNETDYMGGDGLGPGGGGHGLIHRNRFGNEYRLGGTGGGFGTQAKASGWDLVLGGPTYGSSLLLPLLGGSGGGGGTGGTGLTASGGGGGGGAVLIAASGTVTINGAVLAEGGGSGASDGANCGGTGGGGSGGGVRIVAASVAGDGKISAEGGAAGAVTGTGSGYYPREGTNGGHGRIRIEAEVTKYTAATTPSYSFGPPGDLFVVGLPTLRIAQVAGVAVPMNPTGIADIVLPADTPNPVTVELEATGIPLGNVVRLTVTPARGEPTQTVSDALSGDTALSTAEAQIDLPQGPSTLLASITYTLVADLGAKLERFTGEAIKSVRLEASLAGNTRCVLLTEGGREVVISPAQLALASG
jgi:hypothetical protein